ncbi:hypothetical protein ACWEVP_11430 [Amycolatopsis sp. NPDC003865]
MTFRSPDMRWRAITSTGLQPALQNFLIAAVALVVAHLPAREGVSR